MAQDSKSQTQNKKSAFRKLADKLVKHFTKSQDLNTRSSQALKTTRSYHEPENRGTDHVPGEKFSNRQTVGRGDIGPLIEARIRACQR
jgi:protein subunit release factor A